MAQKGGRQGCRAEVSAVGQRRGYQEAKGDVGQSETLLDREVDTQAAKGTFQDRMGNAPGWKKGHTRAERGSAPGQEKGTLGQKRGRWGAVEGTQ